LMLKQASFHVQAHLNAFLQILEYFSQICLGPLARESSCSRNTCHIITACKYTERVNVAPAFCTYIPELPSSILDWGKLKARKCWESCPTSVVQQQLDRRLCTSRHLPVTLPSTSCNNIIQ